MKQGFIVRYSQFCENFKFDYVTVLVACSVERREIKFALHVKQDHFLALMNEKACCKCGTHLGFYFFVARVNLMLFYLFLDIMLFLFDFHAFRKHNNVKISCEILKKKGRNIFISRLFLPT